MPRTVQVTQEIGSPPTLITIRVTTTDTTPVGQDVIEAFSPEIGQIKLTDSQLTSFRNLATTLVAKARTAST